MSDDDLKRLTTAAEDAGHQTGRFVAQPHEQDAIHVAIQAAGGVRGGRFMGSGYAWLDDLDLDNEDKWPTIAVELRKWVTPELRVAFLIGVDREWTILDLKRRQGQRIDPPAWGLDKP
jgi:hypothetical protein